MNPDDFRCKCGCGANEADAELLMRIGDAENIIGRALEITDGYRCPVGNRLAGGHRTTPHLDGHAAHIRAAQSHHRYAVLRAVIQAGFRRIGIGADFIHVDIRRTGRGAVWLYWGCERIPAAPPSEKP